MQIPLGIIFVYLIGAIHGPVTAFDRRSINDVMKIFVNKEICMDELGCFNNGPPFFDVWERPLSLVPDDRKDINTVFKYFSRGMPHYELNITITDRRAGRAHIEDFQASRKTVFIVPGFMSEFAPPWSKDMKDAILKVGDYNVFLVSWNDGDGPLYEQAVANTRVVGAEIAEFITFLKGRYGARPEQVHIIGHSLGSHIAGYAGKRIFNLGRITGLDPAGPYFENVDPHIRLDASDAIVVDTIHTDGASSRFQGFGTTESIGDFDFFPNGGHNQPGCVSKYGAAWELIKHPLSKEDLYAVMCDHHRSILMYLSSIVSPGCQLLGAVCKSWEDFNTGRCRACKNGLNEYCLPVGFHLDEYLPDHPLPHVDLYFNTTALTPYCM